MRPGEESELTMDDFHMDSNGEGIWVRKLVGKALNGRESNYIWCLIPYNNNVNETDYASIVVSLIKLYYLLFFTVSKIFSFFL